MAIVKMLPESTVKMRKVVRGRASIRRLKLFILLKSKAEKLGVELKNEWVRWLKSGYPSRSLYDTGVQRERKEKKKTCGGTG